MRVQEQVAQGNQTKTHRSPYPQELESKAILRGQFCNFLPAPHTKREVCHIPSAYPTLWRLPNPLGTRSYAFI